MDIFINQSFWMKINKKKLLWFIYFYSSKCFKNKYLYWNMHENQDKISFFFDFFDKIKIINFLWSFSYTFYTINTF